ncbi:LL-diaminopimelate aminotransferase [Candidatus Contubernalis alkaliaceticus]|uniref:LL-diaminopimelate aminotransferase n=1 Tax=Candidatus Contubernalis alkaliaceticus TaxID=338645 RepID=UPI001F4C2E5E|nr:LL-diaminopimelate aminotransferase [Candidatus Contubernalis alkalaceticus]UNC92939.1 LL-diaminopimelate aminotransferase [Candidatus Contubernalis alkalaceticus]
MKKKAGRIEKLPPYLFAEIDKKIREALDKGVDVIKLGIGDPDRPTPAYIVERMQQEVTLPRNHSYPPDEGLMEFREAVSRYYLRRFGVKLDPQREVLPLIGSKEGIAHISACFVDSGDVNLVPDPGYPVYGIGTLFAGGQTYRMPLLEENSYLPDLSIIPEETARRAKLMFLNYPNNPTGAVAEKGFFEKAVEFAKRYDVVICHDSAYLEISFDGYRPVSFLEASGALECGIEFGSLSKPFNMTGWRVGYAVGNAEVLEALYRYKTNIDSGNFKAVQYAGVEALDNPKALEHMESMQKVYQDRRNVVVEALREAGWTAAAPKASFYVWAPVPQGYTSTDFVSYILEETGVVVTPGSGFGEYGEGYFRIALTVEVERLKEAMDRIKGVVRFKG